MSDIDFEELFGLKKKVLSPGLASIQAAIDACNRCVAKCDEIIARRAKQRV
jgi:hypothetical protein